MADIIKGGFMAGKKTYIVMGLAILGAIGTYLTGDTTLIESGGVILGALGLGGLRDGIAKLGQ